MCAHSGTPLAPGEKYVATLVERQGAEELERVDYSLAAWEGGNRPHPPLYLFASWRATMATPDAKKQQLALDDEELLDLFEQLSDAGDVKRQAFRFLLSLLLIRKRVLRYEGQRPGIMLVREVGTDTALPPMEVVDPGSAPEAISAAIEQLGAIMNLEVKIPGKSAPATAH
jgi:hypothetical protein